MKRKIRGNGQGCAYKRNRTWTAQVIVGWKPPEDLHNPPIPIKRTRSGFKTKSEALAFCPELVKISDPDQPPLKMTLGDVFEAWEESYQSRIGQSTMAGYRSAFGHFDAVRSRYINSISAADLQNCMDACTQGKRTHQLMKVLAGLLWAYAMDSNIVEKDVTKNLYTGKGKSVQRKPITEKELEIIRNAIGIEPYAEYVYAQCYLGYRPGELLGLKKTDLHEQDGTYYFVAGAKTEAGIDRTVVVHDKILGIILKQYKQPGTEYIFPMKCYNRKNEFVGYKKMETNYYNKSVFKPLITKLNLDPDLVPYSARHTFADKLKNAAGDERDKAALMGHTDYDFTRARYQSTNLDDLKLVTQSIT